MKQLVIIGASGHGKVVADIARKSGFEKILFLDDRRAGELCETYEIVGTVADIEKFSGEFFVAIGNAQARKAVSEKLKAIEKSPVTLIHPQAVVGENVTIGKGSVVMAGAVINPNTVIGEGCIINTCASVDHDNVIGDYVHISVGAHLAGTVVVENNTWIGAGAIVNNNTRVCADCMIGAGAVVVKDIEQSGTYIGVPAKRKQ